MVALAVALLFGATAYPESAWAPPGGGWLPQIGLVATPHDPDNDGDFVCPHGVTSGPYCSEDERGPTVRVVPHVVVMRRLGLVVLYLDCGQGYNFQRCHGQARITARVRVGRRFRTLTLADRGFSIPPFQATAVVFRLSAAARRRVEAGPLDARVAIDAQQADSRSARTSTHITIIRSP